MTDDEGYKLCLTYFKAGDTGRPMPAIPDGLSDVQVKCLHHIYSRARKRAGHK